MQIFLLHSNATKAADQLCEVHANSQVREALQVLVTAMSNRGVRIPGPVDCGDRGLVEVFKPFSPGHPIVHWAQASRAHMRWTLQHALKIASNYKAAKGKNHMCYYQLAHFAAHVEKQGWPADMPETISPEGWLRGLTSKQNENWAPRVATKNAPSGCEFGLLVMEEQHRVVDDCTASYQSYYDYKRTHQPRLQQQKRKRGDAGKSSDL